MTGSYNYRRGLWRLWIVVSVLWIAGAGAGFRPDEAYEAYKIDRAALADLKGRNETFEELARETARARDGGFAAAERVLGLPELRVAIGLAKIRLEKSYAALRLAVLITVAPPFGLLLLVAIFPWISRGFARRQ